MPGLGLHELKHLALDEEESATETWKSLVLLESIDAPSSSLCDHSLPFPRLERRQGQPSPGLRGLAFSSELCLRFGRSTLGNALSGVGPLPPCLFTVSLRGERLH